MKKKIFIHLGFHKTATTYIQKILASLQKPLEINGFYYNELNDKPGHQDIAHKIKNNYLNSNGKAKGYLANYAKVKNSTINPKPLIPIFSSEVLTDCPVNIISDEINLISKDYEINIIITIRQILDQAKSLFQEQLKWGNPLKFISVEDWLGILEMNDLSLSYAIDIINSCKVNNYKLHVIKVSKTNDPSNVLSSFASVTGIPKQIMFNSELSNKVSNKSYDPFFQIMLEKLNSLFLGSQKDLIDFQTRNQIAINALNTLKNPNKISPEKSQKIISALHDVSSKLLNPPEKIKKIANKTSFSRDLIFKEFCNDPSNGSWSEIKDL